LFNMMKSAKVMPEVGFEYTTSKTKSAECKRPWFTSEQYSLPTYLKENHTVLFVYCTHIYK
jgi:hypothetical protein